MNIRLVWTVFTTLLEGAGIALLGLWLLPKVDFPLPLWVVLLAEGVLLVLAVYFYHVGTVTLDQKPLTGAETIIGSSAVVVENLNPQGMVRLDGELWEAVTSEASIPCGQEVVVIGRDKMRLRVKPK
ncbi:MAG: NfeD family protein [Dehalococcoides mccartyi]|uniref:NfeD family protein n=1 Tax=Dehalococcoides mccartyi TaxID=61435 RepID=UPI0025C9ED2B|nr:NfeD family protein [Dehalococcoides mccartyi]MDN4186554.1 NfeD family protein [Dehalococcoides mccartyi]